MGEVSVCQNRRDALRFVCRSYRGNGRFEGCTGTTRHSRGAPNRRIHRTKREIRGHVTGARKSLKLGSCCNLRDTWEGRLADGENEREQEHNGGDEQERENGAEDVIGEAEKEVGKGRGFRGHCGEGLRGYAATR